MKKLILLFMLVVISLIANAQFNIDNPNNRAYFGARLSLDISNLSTNPDMYSAGAGFSVGAIYQVPIFMNLYVEPGLSLYYNTYGADIDTYLVSTSSKVKNFGIKIPINVGYHIDFEKFNIGVFTGPALRIGFLCEEHTKEKIDNHTIKSEFNLYSGLYNRCDLAWAVGANVNFKQYYFGISGDFGLTRQIKGVKSSVNTCQFTLGYNF